MPFIGFIYVPLLFFLYYKEARFYVLFIHSGICLDMQQKDLSTEVTDVFSMSPQSKRILLLSHIVKKLGTGFTDTL